MRDYARNVVALCEMKHKTAGLFEPEGWVFGYRVMSARATVAGIRSDWMPLQVPHHN